ncbi:hypothetical protein [Nonomuraea sp. GTA35]|uniref:hypothetical protein n=1 Tax=Nonomuraea sp. GTA35 TaxID=1676746 RepID=UPI0035C217AE
MIRMRAGASQLLDLFTTLNDPVGMADALATLAWSLTADGNGGEQALALAEQALRTAADAGYLGGQARAYHVMAIIHGEDDPQAAHEVLEQATKVAEALLYLSKLFAMVGDERARATAER